MGLVVDAAVRQHLLELLYSFVGDLSIFEVQRLEAGQTFKVHEALIGDLCVAEVQHPDVGQSFQVLQASVGDLGVVNRQLLKVGWSSPGIVGAQTRV